MLRIHSLEEPTEVRRTPFGSADSPDAWPLGAATVNMPFQTDAGGACVIDVPLKSGVHRAVLELHDRFGRKVSAIRTLHVFEPNASRLAVRTPSLFRASASSVEVGETFKMLWGTGFEQGRAIVEIQCGGRMLRRFWTDPGRTQAIVELKVEEEMRGGFSVSVSHVRGSRAYLESRVIDVPWTSQRLTVAWERFRSKLEPGQRETWAAVITGPDARRAAAEMVATLYDASLDTFLPHPWMRSFLPLFRREATFTPYDTANRTSDFRSFHSDWGVVLDQASLNYRSFGQELLMQLIPRSSQLCCLQECSAADYSDSGECFQPSLPPKESPSAPPDLFKVKTRKNLNETAFFFPHLTSGRDGVVRMEFTIPEALTEWRFMGFAHDAELRSGYIEARVVTAKELMVEPNPPRFVREGDVVEFTAKVSNEGESVLAGKVSLLLSDALSMKPADAALGNDDPERSFQIPPGQSQGFSWRLSIPDGLGFLSYKVVAATSSISDGEEGCIPVLSRRIFLTESMPLPIRGAGTKEFLFRKLLDSGNSKTLRGEALTVQMTSQPAWLAVMALPYLMEFPHECSEQTFSRFYANVLARHIAESDPKIRRVFDLWRDIPALDSPLEKNQQLKSVMIEETPWLRQAAGESQSRRNLGQLFDANRLADESSRVLSKLAQMRNDDGGWPWFPGGPTSDCITLLIATGFGRLRRLGVGIDCELAVDSLDRLDSWIDSHYREILKLGLKREDNLSPTAALYLYGRSFFLEDNPIDEDAQEAVDYFLGQARKHWPDSARQTQAHVAIAINRLGDQKTAADILASLKERAILDEEMGMHWRGSGRSWAWFDAPLETQALMIEAFDEVAGDMESVEACKVWLLKQKQANGWKSTKATADAVYALLLRGTSMISSDALVEVFLDGQPVHPEKVEPGTGFYEKTLVRGEIKPEMGEIIVRKMDDGVSWGAVHWQYLEDIAAVTPHDDTPLKLRKALFVKETDGKGRVLRPVSGPVAVGDELVVRIELRVDRGMDYVHLKDQRGSGCEPVEVLSGYKFQGGLEYYQSVKDTGTHFFIERLPQGTHVFEHSVRVQLKGRYPTGVAEIQCMYAPEFNSHSESIELVVE